VNGTSAYYHYSLTVGKLEGKNTDEANTMFRFLSRNEHMGTYKATEEEKLVEIMNELTDYLEVDCRRELDAEEDELEVLYPGFFDKVKLKADMFKEDRGKGYRELCCVPSFVLGLAMVGRVGRHYMHCSWFNVTRLGNMVGSYGGVSVVE